jgi:hypothetical protein
MTPTAPPLARGELVDDDAMLSRDVLAHLDAQIASAQRLLEVVLEQGQAIRARDVHTVVRLAGLMHGEITRRAQIEQERSRLLSLSGARLGIAPEAVTLTRLGTLMEHTSAEMAMSRSAHLRGLLHELQREHSCNRALMRLELSFLDHLMTSLALDGMSGYDPRGSSATPPRPRGGLHVLDLRA